MDLEGRDAVYTYPDSTRNKNYYANLVITILLMIAFQFKEIFTIVTWKEV